MSVYISLYAAVSAQLAYYDLFSIVTADVRIVFSEYSENPGKFFARFCSIGITHSNVTQTLRVYRVLAGPYRFHLSQTLWLWTSFCRVVPSDITLVDGGNLQLMRLVNHCMVMSSVQPFWSHRYAKHSWTCTYRLSIRRTCCRGIGCCA